MDRLLMSQRLSRKAGVNFAGPTTTLGQTGQFLQLIDWLDEAYNDIQGIHATWQFLRKEFSKVLTPADGSYTATDLSISDFQEFAPEDWRIFLNASDESEIYYMEWKDFRLAYQIGTSLTQTGRPIAFSIKPDDTVVLYPIPDLAYTLKGEYFRAHHEMTANDHTPIFHADYHWAVIWKALTYYASEYGEPDKFTTGTREFRKILRRMEKKYLPRVTWGGALV